jgi:peptidoglycan/xylan/chitin deacetylase (PgdA/CDA1 family)
LNALQRGTQHIKYWKNRLVPGGTILLYHRIAEKASDPFRLCVSPVNFEAQLQVIRQDYHVVSLDEMVRLRRAGKVPRNTLSVTFDDGYADNLHRAKPLLEKYGIPATFFITTGLTGINRGFWWDELERILLQPGTLPVSLQLTINGQLCSWELGQATEYGEDEFERNRAWTWYDQTTKRGTRQQLFSELYSAIVSMSREGQKSTMADLTHWADLGSDLGFSPQLLTAEEIQTLAKGEHITIGAHAVYHTHLSKLSPDEQRDEIAISKSTLESLTGEPVKHFTYPHGDCSNTSTELVRQAGFESAGTTVSGRVLSGTDLYELPRVGILNEPVAHFLYKLERV